MNRIALRSGFVLALVLGAVALLTLLGCGGGGEGVWVGGVKGWVHISDSGTSVNITASRIPPEGYSPLKGATVYILDYPELQDVTDENGYYEINDVPPGQRTIVVSWDGREVRFTVPVRACRWTIGGGHSEGGGGF